MFRCGIERQEWEREDTGVGERERETGVREKEKDRGGREKDKKRFRVGRER